MLCRQLNIYLSVEVRIRGVTLLYIVANDIVQVCAQGGSDSIKGWHGYIFDLHMLLCQYDYDTQYPPYKAGIRNHNHPVPNKYSWKMGWAPCSARDVMMGTGSMTSTLASPSSGTGIVACQGRAEAPTCPIPATPRHLAHATPQSMTDAPTSHASTTNG